MSFHFRLSPAPSVSSLGQGSRRCLSFKSHTTCSPLTWSEKKSKKVSLPSGRLPSVYCLVLLECDETLEMGFYKLLPIAFALWPAKVWCTSIQAETGLNVYYVQLYIDANSSIEQNPHQSHYVVYIYSYKQGIHKTVQYLKTAIEF